MIIQEKALKLVDIKDNQEKNYTYFYE